MRFAVAPHEPEPSDRVGPHGGGLQFSERTQSVDKAGIGGQEEVIWGPVFDALGEGGAGLGDKANLDGRVVFAERTREVGFEGREVGGGRRRERGLRNAQTRGEA